MPVLVAIPARYASTRYPGKPLVELTGCTGATKSLIQRSWEAAQKVKGVDRVVVATDDQRIADAAAGFGAEVVMTSSNHSNGTERCAEVSHILGDKFDIVVNLQGDAPLTPPWFVEDLIAAMTHDDRAALATPVLRCNGAMYRKLVGERAAGRVGGTTAVFATDNSALYFSKEVLPFDQTAYTDDEPTPVFHHVGVYAYRPADLREYLTWPIGTLERKEGLEQLRFLEQGKRVACVEVDARGQDFWELNNPTDVKIIEHMMRENGIE